MKFSTKSILASLFLLGAGFITSAAEPGTEFEVNDGTGRMLRFGILNESEVVLYPNSYSGFVTIPETVEHEGNTYTVTEIDGVDSDTYQGVFGQNVTGLELPDGITTLKNEVFFMTNITELKLPQNLKNMEGLVIFFLQQLEELEIPDGVTELKRNAIFGCMSMHTLTLGSQLTTIESNALASNPSLSKIRIKATTPPAIDPQALGADGKPGNITIVVPTGCKSAYETAWASLGFKAFEEEDMGTAPSTEFEINDGTGRMLRFGTLNDSEVVLYPNDYSGFVTVPATVEHEGKTYTVTEIDGIDSGIYQGVFGQNVTGVELPDCITSFKNEVFFITNITEVKLPKNLKSMSGLVFFSLKLLEELEIPDGVTELGKYAIYGCPALQTLTLGTQLTTIGSNALTFNTSLTTLRIKATTPPSLDAEAFGPEGTPENITVIIPTGCKEAYETAWASFGFKEFVEEDMGSVTSIASESELAYSLIDGGIKLSANNFDNGIAQIYSLSGQLLSTTSVINQTIQVELEPGLYILNVKNGKQSQTMKIVIAQ